jgi:DNA (cytosine-5)-methyltransferase 1
MALTAIDLFCGAGGLSLGLQEAGYTILGAVDSWSRAVDSYKLNFKHPACLADIANLSANDFWALTDQDPSSVDLVAGGPPCQGFSIQRIGADKDSRNNLVLEYGRMVREFGPRMFVMENVPGLLGVRGRSLAIEFQRQMTAAGYEVRIFSINAADYGVPQSRKRVLFFGWKAGSIQRFEMPCAKVSADGFVTVRDAIADLPEPTSDGGNDPLHRKSRLSALNLDRLRRIPAGGGFENLPPELRVNCHKNGASKIGHRNVYGRLHYDRPAVTITARFDSFTRGKFAHPVQNRNITLREGARLQTFPDHFRFVGSQEDVAALIGNAVPPLLARVIGLTVKDQLLGKVISKQLTTPELPLAI